MNPNCLAIDRNIDDYSREAVMRSRLCVDCIKREHRNLTYRESQQKCDGCKRLQAKVTP